MKLLKTATALAVIFGASSITTAQDSYISVLGGLTTDSNSNNMGALTSDFTTGQGRSIPAGTVLPSGTSLAWKTKFESGTNFSLAYGMSYDSGLRGEVELKYLTKNIEMHNSILVGGGSIAGQDAGVLVTGSDALGVTVKDLIAAGTGKSSTWALMANAYYDVNLDMALTPYLGVGIGFADVNNTFAPSDVPVADAGGSTFAYQFIAGSSYDLGEEWSIFADYRYFATSKVETELSLLPGYLDVENENHTFNIGFRYKF